MYSIDERSGVGRKLAIGEMVKILREGRNMTLTQLAQAMGEGRKGVPYLIRLEADDIKNPRTERLEKLAKALGVTVEVLKSGVLPKGITVRPQESIISHHFLINMLTGAERSLQHTLGTLRGQREGIEQALSVQEQRWQPSVVPIDAILPHEHWEESSLKGTAGAKPLGQSIRDDGLINPIVVGSSARLPPGRYLQIDGANRLAALASIQCDHVVAQIVDYDAPGDVILDTWIHVIGGEDPSLRELDATALVGRARQWDLGTARLCEAQRASDLLYTSGAVAIAIFRDEAVLFSIDAGASVQDRATLLGNLTKLYGGDRKRRVPLGADLYARSQLLLAREPNDVACIAFAPFTKAEIVSLAIAKDAGKSKILLSHGLSRHVLVCGRVLGVHADIDQYLSTALNQSTKQRDENFRAWLSRQPVRRYSEPTIVYGEGD